MSVSRNPKSAPRASLRRPPRDAPTPPDLPPRIAALRLLGRRDFTVAELIRRLTDKGYAPIDVQEEVDRLVGEGAVDDRRTALAFAATAARIKGRGQLRIRRELEARGVSRSVIEDVLTTALSSQDEISMIRRFLSRRGITARSSPAERRRVVQQLLRRGYTAEAIRTVLRFDEE